MATSFAELAAAVSQSRHNGADDRELLPVLAIAAEHPDADDELRGYYQALADQARVCDRMAEYAREAATIAAAGRLPNATLLALVGVALNYATECHDHESKAIVFRSIVKVALAAGVSAEELFAGNVAEWLVLQEKCGQPASEPAEVPPIAGIDKTDAAILRCLSESSPVGVSQQELANYAKVSLRTIGLHMKKLAERGLVRRIRGWFLTDEGARVAASLR